MHDRPRRPILRPMIYALEGGHVMPAAVRGGVCIVPHTGRNRSVKEAHVVPEAPRRAPEVPPLPPDDGRLVRGNVSRVEVHAVKWVSERRQGVFMREEVGVREKEEEEEKERECQYCKVLRCVLSFHTTRVHTQYFSS